MQLLAKMLIYFDNLDRKNDSRKDYNDFFFEFCSDTNVKYLWAKTVRH